MLYPITSKKIHTQRFSIKGMFILMVFCSIFLFSCEDFVEVDSPKNLLDTEKVFDNPATVESALANIYIKLRNQGFLSSALGLNTLIGVYTDELEYLQTDLSIIEFQQHTITSTNRRIESWWEDAYNEIYAANDILEGLEGATEISVEDKNRLEGQALFIRAFLHSMLVSLFGDIPYISTTNYLKNNLVEREEERTVYDHIIADLKKAIDCLEPNDLGVERVIPDQITAKALLARVYLYSENWQEAESMATEVITATGYALETDISKVFLKESTEAIWQFKPDMKTYFNSDIPDNFIIKSTSTQRYALTQSFVNALDPNDLRKEHWIGEYIDSDTGNVFYFPHKYKEGLNTKESLEYAIVFRLAEQYLIRAEARTHLGQLSGGKEDLNRIRSRAQLSNTKANTEEELVSAIIQERKVELFSEYGHRWFDLKRTQAAAVLASLKPNWRDTDILLPIPETELELNSNLQPQNDGY